MVLVAVQLSVLGPYLPPVLKYVDTVGISAPDDHFAASPDCRVIGSGVGRIGGAGGCPSISAGVILPAGIKSAVGVGSAPDDHFAAGPHCGVKYRPAGALVVLVAVQLSVLGSYLPPVLRKLLLSAPPQTIISLPVHTAV